MRIAQLLCWSLTLSLILGVSTAAAQEATPLIADQETTPVAEENISGVAPSTDDEGTPSSHIELAKPLLSSDQQPTAAPDVYLLPDSSGNLRKVLGFNYEDFLQAWNRTQPDATLSPPPFVIDRLETHGVANATHIELQITFNVTLQHTGWTDIPIQLPDFIVQQLTIDEQTNGECVVFDRQSFGHVVWLTGQAGSRRRVVLQGLAKQKLNAGTHGVELYLPRATTAQFRFVLPDSNSQFEASPEMELTLVNRDDHTVEAHLAGQANPIRLNWTPAEQSVTTQQALIDVEDTTVVHLDRRRVLYDSVFRINSFDRPLEQIQLLLPQNTKLQVAESLESLAIADISTGSTSPGADEAQGQVVTVRLAEPHAKPWRLHVTAERPLESFGDSSESIVEGLQVLNAYRQTGSVTLDVDDRLQAYFDTHGAIDQTALDATESALEGSSTLGRFRYSRFPWQLAVYASPRQRRVTVEPKYHLTIGPEEANLDVDYNYQLSGSQILVLQIDLKDWSLSDERIESKGLINTDQVVVTHNNRLWLPLANSDTQQVQLNFKLRKRTELGDNTFAMPEPLEAFVVDGQLIVDSTESLRVTPKLSEVTGLTVVSAAEDPLTPTDMTEEQDQVRLRTFLPQAKFVAEVIQRQRKVSVAQRTQIKLDQPTIQVRQHLDYQSKYRPISQISLWVPQQLWLNDTLAITLGNEPLSFGLGSSAGEANEGIPNSRSADQNDTLRQLIVSLPRPMQSGIALQIAYELPMPEVSSEALTPVVLPLAMPREVPTSSEVSVEAPQSLTVTANQRSAVDQWKVVTNGGNSDNNDVRLKMEAKENQSLVSLFMQTDSTAKLQLATLERAWIQSWITPSRRQERAVFRFRSEHQQVVAKMPVNAESTELEVLLDGQPTRYEPLDNNRLQIDLPAGRPLDSHTLELRYQQPTNLPSWGSINNALPLLECRTASAPIYWQLILPRSWQVLNASPELIADYWLGWKNYRWGRQPNITQHDLEQRTGATSAPPPAPLASQYVYRAFEIPQNVEIVVVRQAWMFMGGVLAVFAFGLLWLYTSLAQQGLFWFCVALALTFGIFVYPEVTLLTIEIVLAGGAMVFAASLLRRVFAVDKLPTPLASSTEFDATTELTESWQHHQSSQQAKVTETTATLRTSGPVS